VCGKIFEIIWHVKKADICIAFLGYKGKERDAEERREGDNGTRAIQERKEGVRKEDKEEVIPY
jgi:hypothetical protein